MRALLDRLLAQDSDPRVPVFELVDQRLATPPGRRVPLRATCPRTPRPGASRSRPSTPTPPPVTMRPFSALERGRQLSSSRRSAPPRAPGTICRPPGSSRSGCATRARLLLPSLGLERDRLRRPRLPRGATRTWASTDASLGRSPSVTPTIRCPGPNGPKRRLAATPVTCRREGRPEPGQTPQRVGVAAAQRRVSDQPPPPPRHAPLRPRRRSRRWSWSGAARAAAFSPSAWPGAGWRVVAFDAGPFWDPDEIG